MSPGLLPGLVIFDCDGVLVDSEPLANRVFTEALNEIGLAIGYDEVCREFIGLTTDCAMELVRGRLGRPVPEGFVDDVQARTFAAFERGLRPVRGVREALERIELPVCVASSGEPEKMRLTLGLTGLLERFEGRLFSATEVPRGKPHPDILLHAARSMGIPPEECTVVEDSVPGVRAGRSAGMDVLGYAGESDGARLEAEGAQVFHDMRRLPDLLVRGPRSG